MASATTSKRQRTANTTTAEKEILLGLVQKYQNVVENKKTDGVTTGQKDRAWQLIADEFNSFALCCVVGYLIYNFYFVELQYLSLC